MSSDDDAEELAALRAQRAAKTGGAATLSQLKEQQRRVDAAAGRLGDYLERPSGERPVAAQQQSQQQQQQQGGKKDDDDEDDEEEPDDGVATAGGGGWIEEAERLDDPLRGALPMSFGLQEKKVVNPTLVHDMYRRSASPDAAPGPGARAPAAAKGSGAIGPPRPPAAAGAPAVGPPRPPASFGPPRPPARGDAGAGQGPAVGPPRPPARGGDQGHRGPGGEAEGQGEGEDVGPSRLPQREEGEGEEEGDVGPPRPPSGAEDDDDDVGPPRPPPESGDGEDDEEEGADVAAGADQDDEDDDPYGLPITHEAVLKGHSKAVTCLDVEHTGTRMVTGSMDYTIRLYDFHGMKSDMRSFRDAEPSDGHPVLSVSWSPSGDAFLVVTGSAQAKIYDRDGRALGEFVRGDMYIRDARNTKGHVSGLTCGTWHPTDRYTAMTASEDGTVRIWDTHNILQKTVIKPALARPVRTAVNAVSYNSTGSFIAAGLADGTVQVWGVGGKFGVSAAVGQILPPKPQMVEKQGWTYVSKPSQLVRDAHEAGTEITSLAFSGDGNTLASRGVDGTLKIWDLRRFQVPVHVHNNLPCAYAQTKVIFSPDDSLIITGTGGTGGAASDGGTEGAVVFFNRSKNELVRKVGMPGNVTGLCWHHRLNQIFVGIGNRKGGEAHALYDLARSERGVLTAASRRPRAPNPLDFTPPVIIKTPHALPMFREDNTRKRKSDREATKARRPDPGMVAGRGKQGRIGATGGTLLTQHLLKQRGGLMAPEQEMDPRVALLRHADKAKDEFSAWTAAYRATQPKPVYAQEEDEEEEEGA